jgi:hypothetical protein
MPDIIISEIESMALKIKEKALLLVCHIYESLKYLKSENGGDMKITEGKLTVEYAPDYTVPMTITVFWYPDIKAKEEYRKIHGYQDIKECYSKNGKSINVEVDYIDDWFDFSNVLYMIDNSIGDGYVDYMRNTHCKDEFKVFESVFLNAMFPNDVLGTDSYPYEYGSVKPLTENKVRLY